MAETVKHQKQAGENHEENRVSRYHDPRFWHRRYHTKRSKKVMDALRQSLNRGSCFLDAGTGTGDYLSACSPHVGRAVGIDNSLSDLRDARSLLAGKADVAQASIADLPFRGSSFDLILCTEVLEHVEDFDGALSELFRVGRETIIVTMPCVSGLRRFFSGSARRLFRINLRERDQSVGHINVWGFDQLVGKFKSYGWTVEACTWYISCEPMATYPIPSVFSPCVSLFETLFNALFPRAGNHAFLVCRKSQKEFH